MNNAGSAGVRECGSAGVREWSAEVWECGTTIGIRSLKVAYETDQYLQVKRRSNAFSVKFYLYGEHSQARNNTGRRFECWTHKTAIDWLVGRGW